MVVARSGLEPGDRLIVRGQRMLSDGSLVEVTEVSPHRDGSMDGDPPSVREDNGFRESESAETELSSTEAVRR